MKIKLKKNVEKNFSIIKIIMNLSFYYVNVVTVNKALSSSNGLQRLQKSGIELNSGDIGLRIPVIYNVCVIIKISTC